MTKPIVAITMGDPAGVGPETLVGAWNDPRIHADCRPVAVGNASVLRRAAELLEVGRPIVQLDNIDQLPAEQPDSRGSAIYCLSAGSDDVASVAPASIDSRGGQAAYDALTMATELALGGKVDAITTAPLHKVALHRAGIRDPGHTEILARLCGVDDFAMMLYLPPGPQICGERGLGVVHVTLHMALRDVFDNLTSDEIVDKVRLADQVFRDLGPIDDTRNPRLAVAALNPHAGEEGIFGDEEQRIISPAVQHAASIGYDVVGPLPADTLMARAREGEFDAVVAMYHDQGHIALKLLDMHAAVNVTLGLPIVRTSVAHGTAFDLAWQGCAETRGMVEAVVTAARLARARSSDGRSLAHASVQ
ncbi:MAG: 4-hydroxythreonine-4-phosphate dehydrogenase PdxA [Pirellulales bacterium]|nr:4-hydroxythreonine-4-phosphate dehydrogenase PdxA [Pirellulales bacterium]